MRVLNVNSSLDFKTGGGMAERTFQMSHFLAKEGVQCTVLTIDTGHDAARVAALKPAEVHAMPLLWRRFYIPRFSWKTIKTMVHDADVIHLMGHWTLLNALVYIAARRARKPYVICPAGALPLFGRSGLIKRIYNFIIGHAIVRNASGWIAVTSGEFPHFEAYGIPRSRITVIANGVCEEDFPDVDVASFRNKKGLPDASIILFMGRLNLIKGPDLLLQAFASVHNRIPDYHLVYAGPDEGMQAGLVEAAKLAGIADRVHFLGFVGGNDKTAAYRLADLLAVPSRQEAMSIVALEAGVCGTPAILTDQCGFSEIRAIEAGLEVSATAEGLAGGLAALLSQPGLLDRIGPAFQDFVLSRYTWNSVVSQYLDLYGRILAMPTRK
jgi:glycosyltransferase involved in cell wall biosynthesis